MLVMMSAQELANGISDSGHMYAMTQTGRSLTPAGGLQETFGGMEQVRPHRPTGELHSYSAVLTSGHSFTHSCTHSHTDGGVSQAGRQPARQEQSG